MHAPGSIRVGIGGWTFAPWRGAFYPAGLPHNRELAYASRQLTSIEINGTFYRTQSPATFRAWRDETPPGFVFSLKAPRYATHRRVLADAGESVDRFLSSGPLELGERLGPILWQFPPTKAFDAADFAAFLATLPPAIGSRRLRHVVEVRHPSFRDPSFISLLRRHGVAVALAEHETYPAIADVTADFVYSRLQMGNDVTPTCYPPAALDCWAAVAQSLAQGESPAGLPYVSQEIPEKRPRDVFLYVIHAGKLRAPAGAMALIERLGGPAVTPRPAPRAAVVAPPSRRGSRSRSPR